MRDFLALSTATLTLFCIVHPVAQFSARQVVTISKPFGDTASFYTAWNQYSRELLAVRSVRNPNTASIAVYDEGGGLKRLLYPAHDVRMSNVRALDIWSTTGEPGGGVLLAGVLISGRSRFSQVIATYSKAGSLTKLWDVFPYHNHNVSVDSLGRVYALGHSILAAHPNPEPLLTRYTAQGMVDRVLMTSADVPDYSNAAAVLDKGTTELVVNHDVITMFVGGASQFIQISQGHLITKTLESITNDLWGQNDFEWVSHGLTPVPAGVVTEVRGARQHEGVLQGVSRFVLLTSGLKARQLWPVGDKSDHAPSAQALIGYEPPDELVFAAASDKATVSTVTREPFQLSVPSVPSRGATR